MGLVYADIELINSDDLALSYRGYLRDHEIKRMQVHVLVDSGAYMLAINESICSQLALKKLDEQLAELADGNRVKLDIVGPVDIRFENRETTVRAMVLPGNAEMVLGSIPMEDMGVLIDPERQQLIVNPKHPYIVQKPLKPLRTKK